MGGIGVCVCEREIKRDIGSQYNDPLNTFCSNFYILHFYSDLMLLLIISLIGKFWTCEDCIVLDY